MNGFQGILLILTSLLISDFAHAVPRRDHDRGPPRRGGEGGGRGGRPRLGPRGSSCGMSERRRQQFQHLISRDVAAPGEWPWAVILGKPQEPVFQVMCGGTLLTETHILTAAHCFVGLKSPPTHARLGEFDLSTEDDRARPVDVAVAKFVAHEGYSAKFLHNDIALVVLQSPVTFNKFIRPACLPGQYIGLDLTQLSSPPIVVGWGASSFGSQSAGKMKEESVPIVSQEACEAVYDPIAKTSFITDTQICAGSSSSDSCSGDSGGPLMSNEFGRYQVIGLVSFGVKCNNAEFPGVYTRVDKFLDWLETAIKAN